MKVYLKLFILMFALIGLSPAFARDNNINYGNALEPYTPKKHEVIFSQEMYPIDAIDPTPVTNPKGGFYTGNRGANQLVVYTPKFGVSTETNEYGGEAIVRGNTVVSLSGADSLIPSDGYVISGHGKAKKWMNENLVVGTKIHIDKFSKELYTYVTSDSFIYDAQQKMSEADTMIDYYKNTLLDYDSSLACNYLSKAKHYLKRAQRNPKFVQKYSTLSIENANSAIAMSVPYKENELKGVWIRPTTTSKATIVAILDDLKKTGINHIFLETYYHGRTIFPSSTMKEYGFIEQNELFAGGDPLKIWIQEAHNRNIKVNIWFETFYVGNKAPNSNSKNILAVKPSWANVNRRNAEKDGLHPSLSEHNGYFLDPANPEVQEFVVRLLREIIYNYKPDGINLDYNRYPQSVSATSSSDYINSNWGYTEYARTEFKNIYGIDPYIISVQDDNWALWCRYRQQKLIEMVRKISNLCRSNDVMFTAVIFPNLKHAVDAKQQNWLQWSKEGLVDGFTPLFLTCDQLTIKKMIYDCNKYLTGSKTKLYAGLFVTFMNGAEEDLVRQIHETRKVNLAGVIIFDNAHFADKYKKVLRAGAFDSSRCDLQAPKGVRNYRVKK